MNIDKPARCTPEMLRRYAREILRAAEHRPTDAEALQWRTDASILDAEADRLSHPDQPPEE